MPTPGFRRDLGSCDLKPSTNLLRVLGFTLLEQIGIHSKLLSPVAHQ